VNIDAFAEKLFYFGDEGVFGRELQSNKGDVGRLETACEGRDVVWLRGRDIASIDEMRLEAVNGLGLGNSVDG